jgi:dTDP-4-amino-4,6-dideoxygalactose transaminase
VGIDLTFADIRSPRCLNLDPEDVNAKMLMKTRGVVFVHFGGNSEGLMDIEDVCEENNVDLICDAAQALGAELSRKARFNCISLQAIKSLTSGDGGVLVCRDQKDAELARKLRWFGYDRTKKQKHGDTDLDVAGFKFHMNDISAAIARGNLEHWDEIQQHREDINALYQDVYGRSERSHNLIGGIWNPVVTMADYESAKQKAEAAGFEIGQHHYRNDKYSVFRHVSGYCPNMDDLGDKYFMLPCHMGMSLEDADKIASTLWGK